MYEKVLEAMSHEETAAATELVANLIDAKGIFEYPPEQREIYVRIVPLDGQGPLSPSYGEHYRLYNLWGGTSFTPYTLDMVLATDAVAALDMSEEYYNEIISGRELEVPSDFDWDTYFERAVDKVKETDDLPESTKDYVLGLFRQWFHLPDASEQEIAGVCKELVAPFAPEIQQGKDEIRKAVQECESVGVKVFCRKMMAATRDSYC